MNNHNSYQNSQKQIKKRIDRKVLIKYNNNSIRMEDNITSKNCKTKRWTKKKMVTPVTE